MDYSLRRAALAGAALALALLCGRPPAARADTVVTTYLGAGLTRPDFSGSVCTRAGMTACYYGSENWTGWNGANNYQSTFTDGTHNFTSGTSITGIYSAGTNTTTGTDWVKTPANQYGGQNGTDPYPELFGPTAPQANDHTAAQNSYSVTFTANGVPGANYFGIWISALDAHNNLQIYGTSGQLVLDFTPTQLIKALGACPTSGYCGNPTAAFSGQDAGEQFAYVSFFDLTGYFSSVSLSDNGGTGFESSNHAVAYFDPNTPFGTVLSSTAPVPEPPALWLLATGVLLIGWARRRRPRTDPSRAA